jgi:hypothetical protein
MNRLGMLLLLFTQTCLAQPAVQIEKSGTGSPAIFLSGFTVHGKI